MITTFVQLLPESIIARIQHELKVFEEKNDLFFNEAGLEEALAGRLCDLEEVLDIHQIEREVKVWEETGREPGEFEYGDSIWDKDGNVFLVTSKTVYPTKISLEDAKEMYRCGEVTQISVDDSIYSFAAPTIND